MKKIVIILFLFTVSSFYITNMFIENLKNNDPLSQDIKEKSSKYNISSIDAHINKNTIKSGKYGKKINYNKTYNKMKKYGTYNESLITVENVKPTISIEDNYDKYLIGSANKKDISLVFIGNNLEEVFSILKKEEVAGTFFIDGIDINKNINLLRNTNNEIEILNYNNSYDKNLFKTSISYLESITKNKVNFCYTEDDNIKLLKLCSRLKLHTIKPSIVINNNLYSEVKNNLDNIIAIKINKYTLKELSPTIKYIKSKGYSIKTINKLLKEKD